MRPHRYADPTRCPDCTAALRHPSGAPGPRRCGGCGLLLDGSVAALLFATLRDADTQLQRLRDLSTTAGASATQAGVDIVPGPATTPHTPTATAAVPAAASRRGLAGASVASILLGLGALCLLVAALVFLAVTWGHLGVGGRTTVLLAGTAAAAAGSWVCGRRGLVTAAETFAVITVATAALDTAGAVGAGWLPVLSASATVAVVAGAAALTAAALTGVHRRTRVRTLVSGQLLAPASAGVAVAAVWVHSGFASVILAGALLAAVAAALTAAVGRFPLAARMFGVVAAGATVALLGDGLVELAVVPWHTGPFLTDGPAAEWVWVAVVAAVVANLPQVPRGAQVAASGLVLLVPAALVVLVAADEGPAVGWPALAAAAAVLAAVSLLVPGSWRLAARASACGATGLGLAGPLLATVTGVAAYLGAHRWASAPATVVVDPDTAAVAAVLLGSVPLLCAAVVLLATGTVAELRGRWRPTLGVVVAATATAGFVAAVTAPVPAVVLTAVALGTAGVAAALCVRGLSGMRATVVESGAHAAAAAALLVAAPSAALTVAATAGWAAVSICLAWPGATRVRPDGGLLARGALIGLLAAVAAAAASGWGSTAAAVAVACAVASGLWALLGHWHRARARVLSAAASATVAAAGVAVFAAGQVAGLPQAWSAAPVFTLVAALVVGSAATRVLRGPVETTAGSCAFAAAVAAGAAGPGATAAYLAVGAALVAAHAMAHRSRSRWAWLGAVLAVAASWVRLLEEQVSVPEAYTLPTAVGLLAFGAWRLRRDPGCSTRRAWAAGLALALLPSLPSTLTDPTSQRAALVAAGCLLLVAAGAWRRWAAPLVAGGGVGALVVISMVWPWLHTGPQWLALAAAGAVLLGVGVTWEARTRDARRAAAYLRALR